MNRYIVVMTLMIMVLAGCGVKERVIIPEHFSPYIEEQDEMNRERHREVEAAPLYRCYLEESGSITLIQSVEAYEEPMLILTELDGQRVIRVEVLYENETEDYGDYVTEDWFLQRLLLSTDQKLTLVRRKREADNEVIAITGATITSEAVVIAVNESIDIWEDLNNEKE